MCISRSVKAADSYGPVNRILDGGFGVRHRSDFQPSSPSETDAEAYAAPQLANPDTAGPGPNGREPPPLRISLCDFVRRTAE